MAQIEQMHRIHAAAATHDALLRERMAAEAEAEAAHTTRAAFLLLLADGSSMASFVAEDEREIASGD